jgi:hypothetical protein
MRLSGRLFVITAIALLAPQIMVQARADQYVEVPLVNSTTNTSLYNVNLSATFNANLPGTLGAESVPFYYGPSGIQYYNGAHTSYNDFTLTTSVSNPDVAYLLMNTDWGTTGNQAGTVQFNFSNGQSYTLTLISGENIRDFNNDGYANAITASYVEPGVFTTNEDNGGSPGRIDMLDVNLSAYSNDTLTDITFIDDGSEGTSRLLLAGVTVREMNETATPEPSSLFLLGSGLTVLVGLVCKRVAN